MYVTLDQMPWTVLSASVLPIFQSGVVDGQYSQSMSVNLFYVHQWEDKHWPLTQLRSHRLLKTPYIPLPLTLINREL